MCGSLSNKVSSTLPNNHLTFVSQGQFIQDGFRRSLASATQWCDAWRSRVEQHLEDAVQVASYQLKSCRSDLPPDIGKVCLPSLPVSYLYMAMISGLV
jgi:hypothetical protein